MRGATLEKNGEEHRVFTVCANTGVLFPRIVSKPRGLWVGWRGLDILRVEPLRPPGLSEDMSLIFVSWSMRPARRRAFVAMARLPGAGVGLENAGCDMVGRSGAFVPSEFCGCGRLREGVTGVMVVVVEIQRRGCRR